MLPMSGAVVDLNSEFCDGLVIVSMRPSWCLVCGSLATKVLTTAIALG